MSLEDQLAVALAVNEGLLSIIRKQDERIEQLTAIDSAWLGVRFDMQIEEHKHDQRQAFSELRRSREERGVECGRCNQF